MKLCAALELSFLLLALPSAIAAGWGFDDATLSIQPKGAGVGGGIKEKLSEKQPLPDTLSLRASDTLKLLLTTKQDKSAKAPHQAFLLLKDQDSGLDISYPLSVKDSGKAKVELKQKDLPIQFVKDSKSVDANLVIASFGSAKAYNSPAFKLQVERDANEPLPSTEALRYGKLDEINHTFKSDPQSPPVIISLVFTIAVLAALPALAGVWLFLGANANHLQDALKSSPASHFLFVGSIVGLEAVFFAYYTSWNLFQTLPVVVAVGTVTFLSGSRALGEVQERRLAGLR